MVPSGRGSYRALGCSARTNRLSSARFLTTLNYGYVPTQGAEHPTTVDYRPLHPLGPAGDTGRPEPQPGAGPLTWSAEVRGARG